MKARVFKIPLSAAIFRTLSPQERYVFALVGHAYNEIMFLQKLLHSAKRAPGGTSPVMDASLSLSMFVLRTLVGKVHEASLKLRGKAVRRVLVPQYFEPLKLTDRWNAVLQSFDETAWISDVRNEGAFHYMTADQWAPHLDDAMLDDAYIWDGRRMGDTLFYWADVAAAVPVMKKVNPSDPLAGLDLMLQELGELVGEFTGLLAHGARDYVRRKGLGFDKCEPVDFEAPHLEEFAAHYFQGDERLK